MLGSTTTTATGTSATTTKEQSSDTIIMNPSSDSTVNTSTEKTRETIGSPGPPMQKFVPEKCLFCPKGSSSFADSVLHMQKAHGLFVPYPKNLVVDFETLFRYLHLVIFEFQECIQCGTERATVQAVQQHMTSKGHCNFNIAEEESEFAEFYDFADPENEEERAIEADNHERSPDEAIQTSNQRPMRADEDSIRLPSGKIISKQSSNQTGTPSRLAHRRPRSPYSRLEHEAVEPEAKNSDHEELQSDTMDMQLSSKRMKRERALIAHRLVNMSANDRKSLVHLPASQQRSLLAAQHRHEEKSQKEERRRQSKIDRKGNKNLYAYWNTETPVYQCG